MDGPWGRVRLTPAHDSAQVVRVPQKQHRIRVASGSPEPLRQPRLVPSDVDLEPVVATASARVPPWEVSSFLFERVNTLRELLWRCASILPVLRRPRADSGGSILLLRHFILLLVVSLPRGTRGYWKESRSPAGTFAFSSGRSLRRWRPGLSWALLGPRGPAQSRSHSRCLANA